MTAPERQELGPLEDFPVGRWTIVQVRGREVGVFNTGERLYAVRNKCPHEGARLCVEPLGDTPVPSAPGRYEYGLQGRVLTCPWHAWQFDVATGEMVFGTGERRLTTYPVAVEDGRVVLDLRRNGGAP